MLTVIAFTNNASKSKKPKITLVLVPNSSIAKNWTREAETRCDKTSLGKIVRYKRKTPEHPGTPITELESASMI